MLQVHSFAAKFVMHPSSTPDPYSCGADAENENVGLSGGWRANIGFRWRSYFTVSKAVGGRAALAFLSPGCGLLYVSNGPGK